MAYDPATFYSMGYDHRGMPIPMHGSGYEVPMDMYYSQPPSSMSSRSRNVANVIDKLSFMHSKCLCFSMN